MLRTSTRSTQSPSILNTAHSVPQAQTVHSTFGIKTPNTDLKAIPPPVAPYQQRASTDREAFLHMQSAMTGAKDIWPTLHNIPIKSCYTESWATNASHGRQLRRGKWSHWWNKHSRSVGRGLRMKGMKECNEYSNKCEVTAKCMDLALGYRTASR
jgi:predicted transcriptional regulator